jgi:hypothetical protein
MDPVTTRPAYGGVKPVNGVRITGEVTLDEARAIGEDNGMRAEYTRKYNLSVAAGEMPKPGL